MNKDKTGIKTSTAFSVTVIGLILYFSSMANVHTASAANPKLPPGCWTPAEAGMKTHTSTTSWGSTAKGYLIFYSGFPIKLSVPYGSVFIDYKKSDGIDAVAHSIVRSSEFALLCLKVANNVAISMHPFIYADWRELNPAIMARVFSGDPTNWTLRVVVPGAWRYSGPIIKLQVPLNGLALDNTGEMYGPNSIVAGEELTLYLFQPNNFNGVPVR